MQSVLKITGSDRPFDIEYNGFSQGSKNAALPIVGASVLFDNGLVIDNVPNISDLQSIFKLLRKINLKFAYRNNKFTKKSDVKARMIVFDDNFFDTRGGFYLIAALINKYKEIQINGYGVAGCKIGERGYENIFKVFFKFGIDSSVVDGNLIIRKNRKYDGGKIVLNDLGICVSGVALILASQQACTTTIVGLGKAPEINDLIFFLFQSVLC